MGLVLDASAALAWLIQRSNPAEAQQADQLLQALHSEDAVVPQLWYSEVANGILVAERRGVSDPAKSAIFLGMLNSLPILDDAARPRAVQGAALALARSFGLTGYDATYLELALRTGRTLATFDRQLAEAVRKAGGRVFGDAA